MAEIEMNIHRSHHKKNVIKQDSNILRCQTSSRKEDGGGNNVHTWFELVVYASFTSPGGDIPIVLDLELTISACLTRLGAVCDSD